jgi:Flp pilus assembly protein TadD
MSDDMRRYLEAEIVERARTRGRQVALVEALYTKSQLKLEYDATMTRTASEAFASRSGNCLSLVLMTAAFAKALDLSVSFQKAVIEDAVDRDGDIYLSIGHVNVTLARRKTDELGYGYNAGKRKVEVDRLTIDFLPPDDLRSMRTRTIDEPTIVAMFLNNRAVEALARGRVDDAYWWAREAIVQAPDHVSAYNTLGVVYARHGDGDEAERTLRYVVERDPGNTLAMSNLVSVLAETGRLDESRRLAATLARIDPEPPFSHYIRGREAMRAGDYRTAKEAFAKEVARAPEYHEFQFWLAAAQASLGEIDDARAHMALAVKQSTSRREHDLYAAKLDRLMRSP